MTSSSSMHETGHSKPGALEQSRGIGWEERWEGLQDWGDTCIPMADSCQCMAKITTIL